MKNSDINDNMLQPKNVLQARRNFGRNLNNNSKYHANNNKNFIDEKNIFKENLDKTHFNKIENVNSNYINYKITSRNPENFNNKAFVKNRSNDTNFSVLNPSNKYENFYLIPKTSRNNNILPNRLNRIDSNTSAFEEIKKVEIKVNKNNKKKIYVDETNKENVNYENGQSIFISQINQKQEIQLDNKPLSCKNSKSSLARSKCLSNLSNKSKMDLVENDIKTCSNFTFQNHHPKMAQSNHLDEKVYKEANNILNVNSMNFIDSSTGNFFIMENKLNNFAENCHSNFILKFQNKEYKHINNFNNSDFVFNNDLISNLNKKNSILINQQSQRNNSESNYCNNDVPIIADVDVNKRNFNAHILNFQNNMIQIENTYKTEDGLKQPIEAPVNINQRIDKPFEQNNFFLNNNLNNQENNNHILNNLIMLHNLSNNNNNVNNQFLNNRFLILNSNNFFPAFYNKIQNQKFCEVANLPFNNFAFPQSQSLGEYFNNNPNLQNLQLVQNASFPTNQITNNGFNNFISSQSFQLSNVNNYKDTLKRNVIESDISNNNLNKNNDALKINNQYVNNQDVSMLNSLKNLKENFYPNSLIISNFEQENNLNAFFEKEAKDQNPIKKHSFKEIKELKIDPNICNQSYESNYDENINKYLRKETATGFQDKNNSFLPYDLKKIGSNQHSKNPQILFEYLDDLLESLKQEEKFLIFNKENRLLHEVKDHMRLILISWITEVHRKFRLLDETLYLTIQLVDQCLHSNQNKFDKNNFQLLGISALYLSCKYEEIYFASLHDFSYVTENTFSTKEIIEMESKILEMVDFFICTSYPLRFLEIYKLLFNLTDPQFYFCQLLIEITLMDSRFLEFDHSLIALSSIFIMIKSFTNKFESISQTFYKELKDRKIPFKHCTHLLCQHLDKSHDTSYFKVIRGRFILNMLKLNIFIDKKNFNKSISDHLKEK